MMRHHKKYQIQSIFRGNYQSNHSKFFLKKNVWFFDLNFPGKFQHHKKIFKKQRFFFKWLCWFHSSKSQLTNLQKKTNGNETVFVFC